MDTINIKKISGFPVVEPRTESIPEFLKTLPFAVWIAEPRNEGSGKFGKAPRNPLTGCNIGSDKPELFGTFEQAISALNTEKYSGIGILLTGNELVGVDIDNYKGIFAERPDVKKWVVCARDAGAYCEISPSGNGLRLFMRGRLPGTGRKVGALEIYDNAQFLTITGLHGKGSDIELIDGQELVDAFLALLPPEKPKANVTAIGSASADPEMVVELCKQMAETQVYLWSGTWEKQETPLGNIGYPSQSEADFALCGYITRKASALGVPEEELADTVLNVFMKSGLYRTEKHRQIEQYAVPKLVTEVLAEKQKTALVLRDTSFTEFATAEPGDIIAGRMFAKAMRGKLLYVSQRGAWLRWDSVRWVWCNCGEEMAAAKVVADKVLDSATALTKDNRDAHKRHMSFALQLQNINRLEAMVQLAKSEEGMSIGHMTELDGNQWLLGVRNGVVNLKDGGLLAPDPRMLITRQAEADYLSEAECPHWLEFLDQIFEGDQETISFIQRALGYSLTGSTTEEKLFICYGHGANGKSVFSNIIGAILGDYSQVAPPALLTARRDGDAGPRNDIARLCGIRLTQINELQQGDRLDEQIVKMLAGREKLSARYLHKEFFDFVPTAKPWLRTNHRPVVTGEDDGIWRRLMLIPFKRKFGEHERDPWLESKLLKERDGILAWMVAGCLDWKSKGLKPSKLIRQESGSYRKESDLLGEFLEEMTQVDDNNERTEQSLLFSTWRRWCETNGVRYGSKKSFTRKLDERGFKEARSNGRRYYSGVKLNEMGLI